MTVYEFNRLLNRLSLADFEAVLMKAERPGRAATEHVMCLAKAVETVMDLAAYGRDVGGYELGAEQAAGIEKAISALAGTEGGEQRGPT